MIIRIIGGLIIILACSYVGFEISKELRGRVKALDNWARALLQIENYICYTKMPLAEIYERLANQKNASGEFFNNLLKYDLQIIDTKDSWNIEIEQLRYLTKEDKCILSQLAENLGKSDTDTQIQTIALAQKNIEQNLLCARENEKRDAKMYKTISFFAGVGIAILLC